MAITGLVQQVRDLSVKGANYRPPERNGNESKRSDTGIMHDWRELPAILWSSIKELVQVRRRDEPIGVLLIPKENSFLINTSRLNL